MTMEAENVTTQEEEKIFTSEVKIAGDVIATIAGLAATEIEGISSPFKSRHNLRLILTVECTEIASC